MIFLGYIINAVNICKLLGAKINMCVLPDGSVLENMVPVSCNCTDCLLMFFTEVSIKHPFPPVIAIHNFQSVFL